MTKFNIDALVLLEKDKVCNRPRISFKVREYVWTYIYDNILKPKKVLIDEKYLYNLTLNLDKFNPEIHKFFTNSPYNSEENKYRPEPKFRIFEKTNKTAVIRVISVFSDKNISPTEYANLIYDGFGSFLINISKKITKEILDEHKPRMDYDYINSFKFPAPFEEQKYIGDNSEIGGVSTKEVYESCNGK